MDNRYIHPTQKSVTCFIHCGDDYLFLERSKDKRVDPGKINGVGGKIEKGEDYITAAIREVEEETGYIITPEDITFCGMWIFQGGLPEDWVAAFVKISVHDKDIPIGTDTPDGKLRWMHKDEVLAHGDLLVDDLHYCFKEIVEGTNLFFMNAAVDEQLKIVRLSKQFLKR